MKKILQLLFFATLVFTTSCSSDKEEPNPITEIEKPVTNEPKPQKNILNISDAKSLVVMERSSTSKTQADESNLFKVLNDGSYVPLNFTNENGSAASAPNVTNVQNLNSNYVLLSGSFSVADQNGNTKKYSNIVVRKTDGAIYDASTIEFSYGKKRLGETLPKTDSEGNIYYYKGVYGVGKLSLNNPENLNVSDYLSSGQSTGAFEVDPKGNCMYKYGESKGVTNSNGTKDIRIRKANGGIYEVKVDGRDNREFWLGSNGKFYFITYVWNNGYVPQIHKVNIDGDNITTSVVWPKGNYIGANVGEMFRTTSQGSYIIKKEKSVVFIDTYYSWGDMNWEFFEDDNSVEAITLPKIQEGAKIVTSKEYYYIATKTELYKVNLNTHDYTSLLTAGEYEIYTLNVDSSDNVLFSGLRLKDGKKIFASIDKAGVLKIVNEEINKKAVVLERIDK